MKSIIELVQLYLMQDVIDTSDNRRNLYEIMISNFVHLPLEFDQVTLAKLENDIILTLRELREQFTNSSRSSQTLFESGSECTAPTVDVMPANVAKKALRRKVTIPESTIPGTPTLSETEEDSFDESEVGKNRLLVKPAPNLFEVIRKRKKSRKVSASSERIPDWKSQTQAFEKSQPDVSKSPTKSILKTSHAKPQTTAEAIDDRIVERLDTDWIPDANLADNESEQEQTTRSKRRSTRSSVKSDSSKKSAKDVLPHESNSVSSRGHERFHDSSVSSKVSKSTSKASVPSFVIQADTQQKSPQIPKEVTNVTKKASNVSNLTKEVSNPTEKSDNENQSSSIKISKSPKSILSKKNATLPDSSSDEESDVEPPAKQLITSKTADEQASSEMFDNSSIRPIRRSKNPVQSDASNPSPTKSTKATPTKKATPLSSRKLNFTPEVKDSNRKSRTSAIFEEKGLNEIFDTDTAESDSARSNSAASVPPLEAIPKTINTSNGSVSSITSILKKSKDNQSTEAKKMSKKSNQNSAEKLFDEMVQKKSKTDKSPKNAIDKSSNKTKEKSSKKTIDEPPEKPSDKSHEKAIQELPRKTRNKSNEKANEKSSKKTIEKSPDLATKKSSSESVKKDAKRRERPSLASKAAKKGTHDFNVKSALELRKRLEKTAESSSESSEEECSGELKIVEKSEDENQNTRPAPKDDSSSESSNDEFKNWKPKAIPKQSSSSSDSSSDQFSARSTQSSIKNLKTKSTLDRKRKYQLSSDSESEEEVPKDNVNASRKKKIAVRKTPKTPTKKKIKIPSKSPRSTVLSGKTITNAKGLKQLVTKKL